MVWKPLHFRGVYLIISSAKKEQRQKRGNSIQLSTSTLSSLRLVLGVHSVIVRVHLLSWCLARWPAHLSHTVVQLLNMIAVCNKDLCEIVIIHQLYKNLDILQTFKSSFLSKVATFVIRCYKSVKAYFLYHSAVIILLSLI